MRPRPTMAMDHPTRDKRNSEERIPGDSRDTHALKVVVINSLLLTSEASSTLHSEQQIIKNSVASNYVGPFT